MGTSGGAPVPAAGGAGVGPAARATGERSAEAPTSAAAVSLIDEHGTTRIALTSSNGDALLTITDAERRVRMSAGTFADGSAAVPGTTGG